MFFSLCLNVLMYFFFQAGFVCSSSPSPPATTVTTWAVFFYNKKQYVRLHHCTDFTGLFNLYNLLFFVPPDWFLLPCIHHSFISFESKSVHSIIGGDLLHRRRYCVQYSTRYRTMKRLPFGWCGGWWIERTTLVNQAIEQQQQQQSASAAASRKWETEEYTIKIEAGCLFIHGEVNNPRNWLRIILFPLTVMVCLSLIRFSFILFLALHQLVYPVW